MKRLALVVLVVLLVPLVAAPSAAAGPSAVTWPPATDGQGLKASPAQADRLGRDLAAEGHFGGAELDPQATAASVWVGDGVSLLAWRVVTQAPVIDPPAAARAELDLVRSAARTAASDGSKTEETAWSEHVVPASRTIDAELAWRHRDLGTTMRTRVILSATSAGMEAVVAECVLRDDVAATFDQMCTRFLRKLAPTSAPADRSPLAIPGGDAADAVAVGASSAGNQPTLTAPTGATPPTPIVVAPARPKTDLRALYVIGGLMVLAAVFLWNRSKRKEMEEEYGATRTRRRWRKAEAGGEEAGSAEPGGEDADADALGDAAEADAPDRDDGGDDDHDDDDDGGDRGGGPGGASDQAKGTA